MPWFKLVLIAGSGLIAGFINTLAGSGSLLTLPVLMFIGLPADVANGTNRISVLFQSATAVAGFKKMDRLDVKAGSAMILPVLTGSLAGALAAVRVSKDMLETFIGVLLVVMFFLILLKPEAWLRGRSTELRIRSRFLHFLVFFFTGFYGGFIQAGVGFFLLASLVIGYGNDLISANALKAFFTLILSVVALFIFILYGKVDYGAGLIMAAGSATGAWLGTKTAVSWGPAFVRYILLLAILASSVKLIFF